MAEGTPVSAQVCCVVWLGAPDGLSPATCVLFHTEGALSRGPTLFYTV